MHNATEGMVHFRNISVVIPSSWTNVTNVILTNTRIPLTAAHIRIGKFCKIQLFERLSCWYWVTFLDRPNPKYGHRPYVLQPGQCREPGKYIHFTPEYLLNEDKQLVEERFGDRGNNTDLCNNWMVLLCTKASLIRALPSCRGLGAAMLEGPLYYIGVNANYSLKIALFWSRVWY